MLHAMCCGSDEVSLVSSGVREAALTGLVAVNNIDGRHYPWLVHLLIMLWCHICRRVW
jgi:hypothetical protein